MVFILVFKNRNPIEIGQTVSEIEAKLWITVISGLPVKWQLPVPITFERKQPKENGFRILVALGEYY